MSSRFPAFVLYQRESVSLDLAIRSVPRSRGARYRHVRRTKEKESRDERHEETGVGGCGGDVAVLGGRVRPGRCDDRDADRQHVRRQEGRRGGGGETRRRVREEV